MSFKNVGFFEAGGAQKHFDTLTYFTSLAFGFLLQKKKMTLLTGMPAESERERERKRTPSLP